MIVTIFKDVYDKTNPIYIDVLKILKHIKNGRWANNIHKLRQESDKANRTRFKNSLPSICFSGKFKERFDNDIIEHSGLTVLDFDHVENLKDFKAEICKDKYTYSAFISPSGDGLKVLVKIPAEIENHEKHYLGLMKKYPSLDKTSRNLSRVCFVSYDPDIYINENSEVFTEKGKIVERKEYTITEAQTTDFSKINIACDIIRNSSDGNKHPNLIRASRLVGGFIAGGLVEECEGVRLLENEINKKGCDDFKLACKTIQDGITHGKLDPIYEKTYKLRVQQIIKEDIIIEDEPARDVVYLDEVREKIIYSFENGTSRGETTHFPHIDEHFRWKRGEVTLMGGLGNHGKSQLIYQMALVKAVKDNYKWGIFSPENMPEEEFYKDLIHSYVGKSTEKHHSNQMSMDELVDGMDFIKEHFFLIYPKNDSPTPEYMNNRFRELIIKHNIDGCIIDPFNQLDNDISKNNGREDQYLSAFLTKAKRFSLEQNVFFVIITHPSGKITKPKNSEDYSCPDVYDLAGGAMWNHKCDNVLFTHRPFFNSDRENTLVNFISRKIKKQKLNGTPGEVNLKYDKFTSRYMQMNEFNPLFKNGNVLKDFTEPKQANMNFYGTENDEVPF